MAFYCLVALASFVNVHDGNDYEVDGCVGAAASSAVEPEREKISQDVDKESTVSMGAGQDG